MLQFSCESAIEFKADQMKQNITVTNNGPQLILFKVKTNKIKAIDARPNTGSIPSKGSSIITVKRNEHTLQNVKILFSYLQCPEVEKDNFKQLWAKYENQQESKQFLVKMTQDKAKREDGKRDGDKYVSIASDSDPAMFQSVKVSKQKSNEQKQPAFNQQKDKKSKIKEQQQAKSQNIDYTKMKKKIQQQKIENKILQQQLQNKKRQLKSTTSEKQLKVDKYLKSQSCEKLHVPFLALITIAVVFFGFGLCLGYFKQVQTL